MSEENENLQKMKNILLETINEYAENVYTLEQINEMLQELEEGDWQEKTDEEIRQQAERLVKYNMPAKVNEENENITIGNEESEPKKEEVPEDVVKACMKLGVTQIKGYFYVNAKQLGEKVDNIPVNANGGKVLMIEVADSSRLGAADRYYGMQDERMILHGTQDEEMEEVTEKSNRPPTNGKLVEPLKKDNPTYVEFSDSEGMLIQERLEDKMNLSVQDLENYKKEVEKLLDKYSQNKIAICENPLIENEQKSQLLLENNENFNRLIEDMGRQYGIDKSDVKSIHLQTTEHTKEEIEQQEDDEPDPHEIWWKQQRMKK